MNAKIVAVSVGLAVVVAGAAGAPSYMHRRDAGCRPDVAFVASHVKEGESLSYRAVEARNGALSTQQKIDNDQLIDEGSRHLLQAWDRVTSKPACFPDEDVRNARDSARLIRTRLKQS